MVHHWLHTIITFCNALGHFLEVVLDIKTNEHLRNRLCEQRSQIALEGLIVKYLAFNELSFHGLELPSDCPISESEL